MPLAAASSTLITFLETIRPTVNPFIAELYTFTLVGGLTLRYTTADRDVVYGGDTWEAGTVQWQDPNNRALGHWKIGLDPDTWQVLAVPRAVDPHTGTAWPDQVGNQPFLAAAFGGAFSGADIEVDYAFFAAPPALGATSWVPIGTIEWFHGQVAEIDVGLSAAVFTFSDYRSLLTLQMPRNTYGSSCRFQLFSPGCGLSASAFAVAGTVGAGTTQGAIVSSIGAPGGSATYALGSVVMTSGANEGFSRMVRAWAPSGGGGGVLSLSAPFYWPLAPGNTFAAYPGCNLTQASCEAFYGSAFVDHFGGTPFIPPPEVAS